MQALADKLISNDRSYEASHEALEVARELEHRRALAQKDPTRLQDGTAHLQALLSSRHHV